jgi:hypothetical protein
MYGRHLPRNYQGTPLAVSLWELNGRQTMSGGRPHPGVTSSAENRINDLRVRGRLPSYLPLATANFSFFNVMDSLTMAGNEEDFILLSVFASLVQLPNISFESPPLSQVVSRVLVSAISSINNS